MQPQEKQPQEKQPKDKQPQVRPVLLPGGRLRVLRPLVPAAFLALAACGAKESQVPVPEAIVIEPATVYAALHGQVAFAAAFTPSGANSAVTWSVTPATGGGTIDATGNYTAPGKSGVYKVTATSVAAPTVSGAAQVTVGVTVTVTPASAVACSPVKLSATVAPSASSQAVTWSADSSCGSITADGTFTSIRGTGGCTATACTQADSTACGSASVTIQAEQVLAVKVSPLSATLTTLGSQPFAATVQTTCGTFAAGK